jgi:hypothetical protein
VWSSHRVSASRTSSGRRQLVQDFSVTAQVLGQSWRSRRPDKPQAPQAGSSIRHSPEYHSENMLGGMPVDDAPENHSPSGQFVGRHSILETPVSWATMNVTTLGILDWHNRTMERFVSWGADGTPWINIGDPLSGMLATVVAERRTVRGDNPGSDPARVNLPWRHPTIQRFWPRLSRHRPMSMLRGK